MHKIIVGLGNFGQKYRFTRHNAGFMVADVLAEKLQCRFELEKSSFLSASTMQPKPLVLVKPLTYMNRSGIAVMEVLRRYEATYSDLLIVYDDIHLTIGQIRLRGRGSAGGHNGIDSVIRSLQTEEFDRLRLGIGKPDRADLTAHVLEPFTKDELEIFSSVVQTSIEAIMTYLKDGLQKAMNIYNRRQSN